MATAQDGVAPERTPAVANRGWVQSLAPLAPIAAVDIAAPLLTYSLLRSSGSSAARALVISGVFPACGVAYIAEAAARVVIVETTSTSAALDISKTMPFAVAALLVSRMTVYGRRAKRTGERAAQVARAAHPNAG